MNIGYVSNTQSHHGTMKEDGTSKITKAINILMYKSWILLLFYKANAVFGCQPTFLLVMTF